MIPLGKPPGHPRPQKQILTSKAANFMLHWIAREAKLSPKKSPGSERPNYLDSRQSWKQIGELPPGIRRLGKGTKEEKAVRSISPGNWGKKEKVFVRFGRSKCA
jgi:hypothetical protein